MSADIGEEFKPGAKCSQSGIYRVVHDKAHEQEHDVTVVHGEPFPPCRGCGHGVTFKLKHKAIHLKNHKGFKH